MSTQSKRTSPRAPVSIRVEYHRLNAFFSEYTRDISKGGIFIKTDEPIPVGTECQFSLSFPNHNDPITLQGVVRRVVEDADEQSDVKVDNGMGIAFKFSDAHEKAALAQLVEEIMVEHLGAELYERLSRSREVGPE